MTTYAFTQPVSQLGANQPMVMFREEVKKTEPRNQIKEKTERR